MKQDAVRDLDQWIPEFVPYRLGVGFRVIELDDVGKNDIGSQTLPPHSRLAADPGMFIISRADPNGDIRGTLHVNVDDGTYDVQVTVTTWDEQF